MNVIIEKGVHALSRLTYMIVATALLLLTTTACSDSNVSDLQLNGDCSVLALSLDNYEGTIDPATRTITVRVPETYDVNQMSVTALALSEGATSDLAVGDKMDMNFAHVAHVKNGDVYLDWTIKVVRDEAKILSFKINDTYIGTINEEAKTITVYVPEGLDLKTLVPTITVSDNATLSPQSGIATDFSQPIP